MRNQQSQCDHDSMVSRMAQLLRARRCADVRADLPGCSRPELIFWAATRQGHVPDVTARGPKPMVIELRRRTRSELSTHLISGGCSMPTQISTAPTSGSWYPVRRLRQLGDGRPSWGSVQRRS